MKDPYDNVDVTKENPFLLKDQLKQIAYRQRPFESVIDLSRGDPIDPPSIRALGVESFFETFAVVLQSKAGQLTNNLASPGTISRSDVTNAWQTTKEMFQNMDPLIVDDAEDVLNNLMECMTDQAGLTAQPDLLLATIARDIQGADYGDPAGDEYIRRAIAKQVGKELPWMQQIPAGNIVLTEGASGAISAIFKMLMEIGYLSSGDIVGSMSPVYSPYNDLAEKYGLRVAALACDPDNSYEPTENDFARFEAQSQGLKLFSLVNPSNPTGRSFSAQTLLRLHQILAKQGAIAVEDTVYRKLVHGGQFNSLYQFAPEQTLLVESVSKFHRSTGLRMGYVLVGNQTAAKIGERFFAELSSYTGSSHRDQLLARALVKAKAPAPNGIFQHTQMVSRPSQWKGLFRILLSENDGTDFRSSLYERWNAVYTVLGLQNPQMMSKNRGADSGFVPYYCLVDLHSMLQEKHSDQTQYLPWHFLTELAEHGVVVLPAAKFFDNPRDHAWAIRISVANVTCEKVERAMQLLNELILN